MLCLPFLESPMEYYCSTPTCPRLAHIARDAQHLSFIYSIVSMSLHEHNPNARY